MIDQLKAAGACIDQVQIFAKRWPRGCPVTAANLRIAIKLRLDIDWAAQHFLSAPAKAAFVEACAPARAAFVEAYVTARATAWAAYDACAPARAAFEKACAPARAAYVEAYVTALIKIVQKLEPHNAGR